MGVMMREKCENHYWQSRYMCKVIGIGSWMPTRKSTMGYLQLQGVRAKNIFYGIHCYVNGK